MHEKPKQPCSLVSGAFHPNTTTHPEGWQSNVSEPTLGHREGLCGGSTYIPDHLVEGLEGGLLVVVVDASVAVQDGDALLLRAPAVAAVHAVVRPVVPLAGEHVQTLCPRQQGTGKESRHVRQELQQIKPAWHR